jgi:thiosulfate/3-mercaptopyruvate sulfurtransferase
VEEVQVAQARGVTLVDARPRHLYLGEKGVAGSGHIPGALSLPYQELVDGATGLFATPSAIARLLRAIGIDPSHPPNELITTCGTGVSATVALIALELAGVHNAGLRRLLFRVEHGREPAHRVRDRRLTSGIDQTPSTTSITNRHIFGGG